MMQTPRLRLYTKNISYFRALQHALGRSDAGAIARTEQLIAGYTHARHAVLTSMGRMAIYEGLRALGETGEIILSPITVPEVISLVVLAGFTPVFCDVKAGTWNIDVDAAQPLITDKTVAIMTTYFYGNMNAAEAVRALCDKHDLWMIEDAAQAIGAWKDGKHAGTIGDFGILSFSYPKNVTSFYGGCLVTNNDEIAARVRAQIAEYPALDNAWWYKKVIACAIKDVCTFAPFFQAVGRLIRYGYQKDIPAIKNLVTQELPASLFEALPIPYRTRISPAQAQAVADKWPEVDADVSHRIACAEIYARILKDVPQVLMPALPNDRSHTFLYFPVQVADKYALQRYMVEQWCDVAVQHAQNCADMETYAPWKRDCPNARAAYNGTLMLPCYRGFPLAAAERYAQTIRRFFA
jgi:perosamine synthetase